MFNSLYGEQTDQALNAKAQYGIKPDEPDPGILAGVGSALIQGPVSGALETGRAAAYLGSISTPGLVYKGLSSGDWSLDNLLKETEAGKALGEKSKSFEPDADTASQAAHIVHGLTKFGTKALGYAMTMGPMGAVAFGTDEAVSEGLRLTDQGVDGATAAQAGLVHGIMSGVGVALPAAGQTLKGTAALVGVGGPGFFAGEQHVMGQILDEAGYADIAKQYDPFDMTGLIVSAAAPGVFGAAAHAMRAKAKGKAAAQAQTDPDVSNPAAARTEAKPEAEPDLLAQASEVDLPPREIVDAVRVHNLKSHESFHPPEPGNAKAAADFAARVKAASDQMSAGEKPVKLDPPRVKPLPKVIKSDDSPKAVDLPGRDSAGVPVAQTEQAARELYKWLGESTFKTEDGAPQVLYQVAQADGTPVFRTEAPARRPDQATQSDQAATDPTHPPATKAAEGADSGVLAAGDAMEQPVYIRANRVNGTPRTPTPDTPAVRKSLADRQIDAAWVRGPDGPELRVARSDQVRAAGNDAEGPDLASRANEPAPRAGPQERPDANAEVQQSAAPRQAPDTPDQADEFAAQTELMANDLIASSPELMVELDDGTRITAAQALADAGEAIATAKTESKAFDAAVQCLLRT